MTVGSSPRGVGARQRLIAMVVCGFALRLLVLGATGAYRISPDQDHFAFGGEMGRIARSVVIGQGFGSPFHGPSGPTAIVGPVYPLLLAAIFWLFGTYTATSAWVALGVNTLCSALTCLPIAALGGRIFGRTVGVWAGWTWVFFPYAVYWPIRWVWDTSLSTLLLTVVLWATVAIQHSSRARSWARAGLLWALAVLTNTTVFSVLPPAVGWLCYRGRRLRALHLAGVAILAVALGLTPWMARNYHVFGHVVLRTNLGLELVQGNHAGATGLREWQMGPAYNPSELEKYRSMGELPYMAEKRHEAWLWISSHPGAFALLTARRVVYFWTGTPDIVLPDHILESLACYTLVSVLAIAGLSGALRARIPGASLLAMVLAIFPLPYYVTHPEARFRHLIEPELVLLAVAGLASVVPALRRHSGPTSSPARPHHP